MRGSFQRSDSGHRATETELACKPDIVLPRVGQLAVHPKGTVSMELLSANATKSCRSPGPRNVILFLSLRENGYEKQRKGAVVKMSTAHDGLKGCDDSCETPYEVP